MRSSFDLASTFKTFVQIAAQLFHPRGFCKNLAALFLTAVMATLLLIAPTQQAQAQVTVTCPAQNIGDFVVLRPDVNTCITFGADTNPNLLIGNNITDPYFYGTSGILFGAEPGTGLSNVFFNGGSGDVNVPIVEAGIGVLFPCASNAACNVTLFFTFDGSDYSIDFTSPGGSNVISATSTPSVVVPPDTTAPTVTSVVRQSPATATTDADSLTFRVTFSEDVQNVDAADFDASGTTGDATSVSTVSASVYDVTVSGGDLAGFNGTVGLTFNAGQNIQDLAANALTNTTPGSNETYTVANGAPEIALSSSESGAVADGGTDAQGTQAAGVAKTVTFTVTNSGTDTLTLATATASGASNVTVNSIGAPGSTSVAGGGTTTSFQVQYTPTLAGAFSFDLSFTNNDADEAPYDLTVSGTASGAPEIALSSSESGAVADGGTDVFASTKPEGVADVVIYTISNTGTDTLSLTTPTVGGNISAVSNVTVTSVTLGSTTVAPGGTTTVQVAYTPISDGAFGFALTLVNDDADENPFDVTASGTATAGPTVVLSGVPTIYSGTATFDVTATFSASVTGFDASDVAVVNGTASAVSGGGAVYTITITPGGGDITVSIPANVATAADGSGNRASASSFIEENATEETLELIAEFMATRSNLLLSHQPNLRERVFGSARRNFQASVSRNNGSFAFDSPDDWPVWMSLTGSYANSGTAEADYLFGVIGGHHWVNENLAVGLMLELDRVKQTDGASSISGNGWLAGPYLAGRFSNQPLYYTASILAGQSSNDVSPLGTYTDTFDTDRLLISADITGEWQTASATFFPSLSAAFNRDAQRSYIDGLGNVIPSQTFEAGQVAVGLDFETPLGNDLSGWLLHGGLQGSYNTVNGTGSTALAATSAEGGRARVELGLSYDGDDGQSFALETFYDGLGASDYESYGVSLSFLLSF